MRSALNIGAPRQVLTRATNRVNVTVQKTNGNPQSQEVWKP